MTDLSALVWSSELTADISGFKYGVTSTRNNYTSESEWNEFTHRTSKYLYSALSSTINYEAIIELDEYTADFVSMTIVIDSIWILANGIWNDDWERDDDALWNDS